MDSIEHIEEFKLMLMTVSNIAGDCFNIRSGIMIL